MQIEFRDIKNYNDLSVSVKYNGFEMTMNENSLLSKQCFLSKHFISSKLTYIT